MGDGAFRDAGAALERAAALEAENEELAAEVARLREGVAAAGDPAVRQREVAKLREELKATLTRLADTTRELDAYESNYRALKKNSAAAIDDSERLKTENARLQERLDRATRQVGDAREGEARWKSVVTVTEVPPNLQAVMQRMQEERDERTREVEELKAKLASVPRRSLLARLFGRSA